MNLDDNLLVRATVDPRRLLGLNAVAWDTLLPMAGQAGVLARIGMRLDEMGLLDQLLPRIRDQLRAAQVVAVERHRIMCWEVNRIRRAVAELKTPIILLKGAAYAVANLPPAQGRLSSDIDVLVPKEKINSVEQMLLRHGWEHIKLDRYDQRYYRTWMHELPPLRHQKRQTIVDVHHTILPKSGRLRPNPLLLLAAAQPIDGLSMVKVLAPIDMVLHSAAHLFQDGELHHSLRDLGDLDDLLRHFGRQREFWDRLVPRAFELDLERPLFYALRYTQRFLGTPIPELVKTAAFAAKPPWPIPATMDLLIHRSVAGQSALRKPPGVTAARWVLYVRAHWLRMPPWLLARHLFRKALTSWPGVSGNDFVRYQ